MEFAVLVGLGEESTTATLETRCDLQAPWDSGGGMRKGHSSGEEREEVSQGSSGNEGGKVGGNVLSQRYWQPGCMENHKDENIPFFFFP